MKILDKYVTRQFLSSIFFGLLTFTLIFIIIDMMEKLDDFIDESVPFHLIFLYYVYFVPEIMRLMLPVATLLASLFTVGKLSNFNELTILRSSGMSLQRLMMPFLGVALLISLFSVYFGGWIVPYSNRERIHIEREYLKKDIFSIGNNIFFQDSPDRIISIGFYDDNINTVIKAGIQFFNPKDLTQLIKRYDIERLKYDSLTKSWLAVNITERKFINDSKEEISKHDSLRIGYLNFRPRDLTFKLRKMEEFTFTELMEILDEQKKSGNDVTRLLIDIHTVFSFSFASIIVVLFGLPFMIDKRKGGIAVQFGMNLFVTFIYLAFQQITKAFGKNGSLDPVLTAWIPNLVFLILAIINLMRIKK